MSIAEGTSPAIADDVTLEKNSSNQLQIKASGVDTTQLADSSVTNAKILDATITSAKLAVDQNTLWDLVETKTLTTETSADFTSLSGDYIYLVQYYLTKSGNLWVDLTVNNVGAGYWYNVTNTATPAQATSQASIPIPNSDTSSSTGLLLICSQDQGASDNGITVYPLCVSSSAATQFNCGGLTAATGSPITSIKLTSRSSETLAGTIKLFRRLW